MGALRNPYPDMPAVAALLAERVAELALELVGTQPTTRGRVEWRFRNRGSLAVAIAGPSRGAFFDHEAGQGGDALALVAHLRHVPMADAWRWALGWLGIREGQPQPPAPPRPVASPVKAPAPDSLPMARSLWREALAADAPGSLVPVWLAARGLVLEPDAPLRFHPACPRGAERWPAMLALLSDAVTGEPCGVHRTFLTQDGNAKAPGPLPARMMAGKAGLVRLVPDAAVTSGLGIAEGIETSLAVMQAFSWRPVWAAASAGMIAGLPVLPGIQALTVFADADAPRFRGEGGHTGPDMPDGAGLYAAGAVASRWQAAGREVRVLAPPRGDFNDLAGKRCA